ncbi:MAG: class I SAM-dependent methyltransferase [Deltaproteobacteria bacterium]|nr:class I SAM-dependent methyltransferase [Deltaproteobacteria bacterium]
MTACPFGEAWDEVFARGGFDLAAESPRVSGLLRGAGLSGRGALLDLGCGLGRHLREREGLGPVVGLDSSSRALARAKQMPGVSCVRGLMTALPFAAGAFSAVLAWRSIYLQSMTDIRRTAGEIRRVLAPGGRLVCSVRTRDNALARHAEKTGRRLEEGTWELVAHGFCVTYHFFTRQEVLSVFKDFDIHQLSGMELAHTAITRGLPGENRFWVFSAQKP